MTRARKSAAPYTAQLKKFISASTGDRLIFSAVTLESEFDVKPREHRRTTINRIHQALRQTWEAGEIVAFISPDGRELCEQEFGVNGSAAVSHPQVFGLPGAYTPTCSAKHVPSYLSNRDKLTAKGVNEIWCVATNDAFVMAHWGKDQKAIGKIRFLADGSGQWAKALGLELDLTARGMGVRMNRFSLLVDNGVVKNVNLEGPGKFEVSDGATMLAQVS